MFRESECYADDCEVRTAGIRSDRSIRRKGLLMYSRGQGVLQDNVAAHMWYNIGSANGNALGGKNRDILANKMTPAASEEAQRRARVCMASNYQDCD